MVTMHGGILFCWALEPLCSTDEREAASPRLTGFNVTSVHGQLCRDYLHGKYHYNSFRHPSSPIFLMKSKQYRKEGGGFDKNTHFTIIISFFSFFFCTLVKMRW